MDSIIELTQGSNKKLSVKSYEVNAISDMSEEEGFGVFHCAVFTPGMRHSVTETYEEVCTALGWTPKKIQE